ncbi:glycoside hydrolase family 16 protein (plasmid) [Deinococcus taeanensis]|uniref:glycoside hydrolase family 16 protein n=1 Tax=Deinococcus taeanensis TaxID=2737050 RepID=UPI001CDB5181|nr:glycoside hydrolase family 16 protein [Deinococcus taeanensis]UBV45001.1 glycoside hydrolase family 16 protein [Deinococcus taeanensis]
MLRRSLLTALFALSLPVSAGHAAPGPWVESFTQGTLDRWVVSNWRGFWAGGTLDGAFSAQNVKVLQGGQLQLRLKVQRCGGRWCAQAAALQSRQKFGFGRYTVRMRAASDSGDPRRAGRARPGNISAAFSFLDDSRTEIDVEIEGHRSRQINTAAWQGLERKSFALVTHPQGTDLATGFHTYTWDWQRDHLAFSVDGREVWRTREHVPQDPAHLMLNVWPTDDSKWGGQATPGEVFMLVDEVKFEPSL